MTDAGAHDHDRPSAPPAWARWHPGAGRMPWSVGLEEELALADAGGGRVVNRAEEVLDVLAADGRVRASAETHACVLELKTAAHATVRSLARELEQARSVVAGALARRGLAPVAAGTHPLARGSEVELSTGPRQREVAATTRALAHREPTMALHVHVGVPTADQAVRALDGLRGDLPVLLALGAGSPFWRGADSGFASFRVPLFDGFPRTGLPRRFGSYGAYVGAVEALLRAGAIPEPGFVWWDARLRPALGTVEVRVLDAQARLGDVTALAALVQCLVRRHAEREAPPAGPDEVLAENRFLAARDGMRAQLIDPRGGRRITARAAVEELLTGCQDAAAALGCAADLVGVEVLAASPSDVRQRRHARREGVGALPGWLAARYAPALSPVPAPDPVVTW